MGKRGRNRPAVFVQCHAQSRGHMKRMRLAHQTHRRGISIQNGGQNIVVLNRSPHPFGHPKRGHCGARWLYTGKKLRIRRVRAGPAPFDVIHAKRIQRARDLALIKRRKLHPLGLLAIAQGGVEKVEAFFHTDTFLFFARGACDPGSARTAPTGRALCNLPSVRAMPCSVARMQFIKVPRSVRSQSLIQGEELHHRAASSPKHLQLSVEI